KRVGFLRKCRFAQDPRACAWGSDNSSSRRCYGLGGFFFFFSFSSFLRRSSSFFSFSVFGSSFWSLMAGSLTSHRQITPSLPPVASVLPSGLKASESTRPVCESSVLVRRPVSGFHSLTLRSLPAVASVLPEGLNATSLMPSCSHLISRIR